MYNPIIMKSKLATIKMSMRPTTTRRMLEFTYKKMSIDEIRKTKPKSRLESFLRRKALEAHGQVL